jgi:hypothetical protein
MLQHLINLRSTQLIRESRHIGLAVMDDLVQLGIAQLLHVFRAEIGGLQLFAQRRLSTAVRSVAKHALGSEDAGARRFRCLLRDH